MNNEGGDENKQAQTTTGPRMVHAEKGESAMSRHFIKDKEGKDVKTSNGERLFWSDIDGDSHPDNRQTVYRERKSGGSEKVNGKYDLLKGIFKK